MIVIDRKVIRTQELAWLVAFLAELRHERAAIIIIITREYLHSMIVGVGDKQETSMMVEHQALREGERAFSIAIFLGADRELDSSITIKNIVSHLFQFNLSLSLSHNDKEMIQAPNCSSQRDEDMKPSLTHETRERHQASKQRATRSNKNQSMKEQRTAPPSLTNHSLALTSLFLIMMVMILLDACMPFQSISKRERERERE